MFRESAVCSFFLLPSFSISVIALAELWTHSGGNACKLVALSHIAWNFWWQVKA